MKLPNNLVPRAGGAPLPISKGKPWELGSLPDKVDEKISVVAYYHYIMFPKEFKGCIVY